MILLKRTSAWDELSQLVDRDEELGKSETELIKLRDLIEESGKEDSIDNVVSDEFPKGAELDELKEFFTDEQDFILEQLGISNYDDADEELDEEEEEDEY